MDQVLEGKVAIITGGAGGIGSIFGRELALRGAAVVLADLNGDGARKQAETLVADGHRAIGADLDVTDPATAVTLVEQATAELGGVDILVNSAALMAEIPYSPLSDFPLDWWDRVMAVNLRGPLVCTQAVVPAMVARGGGRIVNIVSAGAFIPGGVYGISKYALVGLTMNFANELGAKGINVNAIAPGLIVDDAGYRVLCRQVRSARRCGSRCPSRPTSRVRPRTLSARWFFSRPTRGLGSRARPSASTVAGSCASDPIRVAVLRFAGMAATLVHSTGSPGPATQMGPADGGRTGTTCKVAPVTILPGPRERHAFDPETQTYTFVARPNEQRWSGCLFVLVGLVFIVVGGYLVTHSRNDVIGSFAVLVVVGACVSAGIRLFQVRAVVSPDEVAAYDFFSTHRAEASAVEAVDVVQKRNGKEGYRWVPRVRLTDGRTFWITALHLGSAPAKLEPEGSELLSHIRDLLDVSGESVVESVRTPLCFAKSPLGNNFRYREGSNLMLVLLALLLVLLFFGLGSRFTCCG